MITVVIVTRDRATLLRECLQSLSQQEAPEDWRVLVVVNGSSDDSVALARSFAACDPRFRVVEEPEPGASRARNRGAREAKTPYVLFVDDECTFPSGYVARACVLAAQLAPSCFGGPVHPRFASHPPRPAWYKDEYGAFSLPTNNPRGGLPRLSAGNLGLRRDDLLAIGGFPEALGPVGGRMLYGEENAVIAAIWDRSGPAGVLYDPTLVNHHLVRPEKYRWSEIFLESFRRGVARGRLTAWGLDETGRLAPAALSNVGGASLIARIGAVVADAVLDVTLLRRLIDSERYPDWRNVVYERWTRYVMMLGFVVGWCRGRRETAVRR